MATLTSILPVPLHKFAPEAPVIAHTHAPVAKKPTKEVPPYGQRQGYIPRTPEDFGDGGAFPEIHVAQYPLNMGRKDAEHRQGTALTLDSSGKIDHTAVLGVRGSGQKIQAKSTDLIVRAPDPAQLARPSEEEIQATTEKTRAALEKRIDSKLTALKASRAPENASDQSTFVHYTPSQTSAHWSSGPKTRVMRMVDVPVDPLEPPKFKIMKKSNHAPSSPPAPVMHSPPRKMTSEEVQDWKIPPCISNWKNPRGYTIPLDKRLAADGRGLQEHTINDNFAKLSESLYIAERNVREQVAHRNQIREALRRREIEQREDMLRKMAEDTRRERAGLAKIHTSETEEKGPESEERPEDEEDVEQLDEGIVRAREERDKIRQEQSREIERMRRMEAMGKKTKLARDANRDISEKIALGQKAPATRTETQFDQRLFNQDQGLGSGFEEEDAYNVYSKPLFQGSSHNQLYRPKAQADGDVYGDSVENVLTTARFKVGKGFEGAEPSKDQPARSGPVAFEKEDDDPFGFDAYLTESKKPLDAIGKRGELHAGAAGGMAAEEYRGSENHTRKNIAFEKSSSSNSSTHYTRGRDDDDHNSRYKSSERDERSSRSDRHYSSSSNDRHRNEGGSSDRNHSGSSRRDREHDRESEYDDNKRRKY